MERTLYWLPWWMGLLMSDLFYTNEPHAEEIHSLIEIGMLIPVGEDDGSEASDREIIETINKFGIDHARLKAALDSKDPWGHLVHSFEYVTVLGVVESAMKAAEATDE